MRETIRKEVRGEMRAGARKRRGWGCLGCLLFFVLILMLLAGGALFFISRTGLVAVPVFSHFYAQPAPTRVVVVRKGESFEQIIKKQFEAAAREAKRSGRIPETVTLTLPESNLTSLLNDAAEGAAKDQGVEIKSLQVAILPGTAELFADAFLKQGVHLAVRAQIVLEVVGDRPVVRVESATLGMVSVSPALLNALVNQYLNPQLVAASQSVAQGIGQVIAITAESGVLKVTLKPNQHASR